MGEKKEKRGIVGVTIILLLVEGKNVQWRRIKISEKTPPAQGGLEQWGKILL